MYKYHKILACILFCAVFFASYMAELKLTKDFITNLITFFSIVFGFYLTGLSILFGTKFSKRLRQEEDPRKNTQTKLHTLRAYFNFSSFASLSSIVFLLFISLMGMTIDCEHKVITEQLSLGGVVILYWDKLLTAVSLGLAATNIMFMCLLFQVFFNGFIEEGRKNE